MLCSVCCELFEANLYLHVDLMAHQVALRYTAVSSEERSVLPRPSNAWCRILEYQQ